MIIPHKKFGKFEKFGKYGKYNLKNRNIILNPIVSLHKADRWSGKKQITSSLNRPNSFHSTLQKKTLQEVLNEKPTRKCLQCGKPFEVNWRIKHKEEKKGQKIQKYCSKECRNKHWRMMKKQKKKAKKNE